ncbi:hypothetical protein K7X08_017420 [Anisodus acutangulus]|uniref:Uncharacterized protein n=1 Tax=Anisodus acutangulus TaxID=402998 RepID=A0A9Q1LXC0_9SOLA|nr:hypothetical protein K7X08_017420 [Anisodus acutangulus]
MALYNLSTYQDNLNLILQTEPIHFIISLLKSCKKSSKTAEKCTALIESSVCYEEGRTALTSEGGILAVVEVLESGSLQSREHAVGALLTMCQSDRCKYREPILKEGIIPGLLELTVQGTNREEQLGKTKEMLAEMVGVSMEQSLRHLQQRALICTPADLSISSFKELEKPIQLFTCSRGIPSQNPSQLDND